MSYLNCKIIYNTIKKNNIKNCSASSYQYCIKGYLPSAISLGISFKQIAQCIGSKEIRDLTSILQLIRSLSFGDDGILKNTPIPEVLDFINECTTLTADYLIDNTRKFHLIRKYKLKDMHICALKLGVPLEDIIEKDRYEKLSKTTPTQFVDKVLEQIHNPKLAHEKNKKTKPNILFSANSSNNGTTVVEEKVEEIQALQSKYKT